MGIDPVTRILDTLVAPYALIGGHALAARGYPRFTIDIDILTSDPRVLDAAVWGDLQAHGVSVDPRRGDADDPLGGVVHILLIDGTDIDLVVAKERWQAELIGRAEPLTVFGREVPVPRTSDLILLKLAAGGYADLQDAAALLALGDRDRVVQQVETRIGEVRPDIRAAWRDLLAG